MQKKEIKINIGDFPEELHYIFKDTKVYDSSSHPTMTVLYSELGYYVKIAEKDMLRKEAELTEMLDGIGLGVRVVHYISTDRDYMVTLPAKGEDALHYLDDPERLCRVLAETMRFLHSRPIDDIPLSPCMETYAQHGKDRYLKRDTFIHGDFCLPNIILDDWRFSTFIDVGLAGVGDKHIDIYWALWSLEYNLKTDKYNDVFLDIYGRDDIDFDVLKIVEEVEANA